MSRIYLLAIIIAVLLALTLNNETLLYEPYLVSIFQKEFLLSGQILISAMLFLTLILLIFIGLIEKIIMTLKSMPNKKPKEMAKAKKI